MQYDYTVSSKCVGIYLIRRNKSGGNHWGIFAVIKKSHMLKQEPPGESPHAVHFWFSLPRGCSPAGQPLPQQHQDPLPRDPELLRRPELGRQSRGISGNSTGGRNAMAQKAQLCCGPAPSPGWGHFGPLPFSAVPCKKWTRCAWRVSAPSPRNGSPRAEVPNVPLPNARPSFLCHPPCPGCLGRPQFSARSKSEFLQLGSEQKPPGSVIQEYQGHNWSEATASSPAGHCASGPTSCCYKWP